MTYAQAEIEVLGRLYILDSSTEAADDWIHYRTPSWTRLGIWHSLHVNRHTGELVCECEDCVCRKKACSVFDKCAGGCKHSRGLYVSIIGPHLENELRRRGL